MNCKRIEWWWLVAAIVSAGYQARACGPFFPNTLLDKGDAAVLSAPVADFTLELQRIKLPPARFKARPDAIGDRQTEADLAELRQALRKTELVSSERQRILAEYKMARQQTAVCKEEKSAENAPPGRVARSNVEIAGLPGEFADYLRGARAYHDGDLAGAQAAWEALLAKPENERHYRSTWAAYMLGRLTHERDPDKAIEYYRQVRELAQRGFADCLGLAAASYGWEAQIHKARREWLRAIELYFEQHATGDTTAWVSLNWTAGAAIQSGPETLSAMAHHPLARQLVTAWLISRRQPNVPWQPTGDQPDEDLTAAWLKAMEAAGVKDVESAERLALAAYQAGQFELATGWLAYANSTPAADWLRAKLLLRAGKLDQAAALLSKVARDFPPDTRTAQPQGLKDTLLVSVEDWGWNPNRASVQVQGELGVLHLARRDYTEALDVLLRAGFWTDAAYVAERVLTVDELRRYVDRNWPPCSADRNETIDAANARKEIRYLLARRLAREQRSAEARGYYPAEWQGQYEQLQAALRTGRDTSLPNERRAEALFAAALITRTNGMELLGTELEPDWHLHDGQFQVGPTWRQRAADGFVTNLTVTADEKRRASEQRADPERRFHYRYQAAELGWEAAKLMPDNSEETAMVLCRSGSWIKNLDPQAADRFYKALVRRCANTEIGGEAARLRWFPKLDERGKVIPIEKEPRAPETETVTIPELLPPAEPDQ